jgi:hypothetical protein
MAAIPENIYIFFGGGGGGDLVTMKALKCTSFTLQIIYWKLLCYQILIFLIVSVTGNCL